ncbi:protein-tyrosine phosphatase [Loa loa]|uniref:Protein-tyrosine phosphatase n=1 Tax=Loa loa TaxID=7209 RepID=A0A1S0U9M2_LOALO|nr:protein-tyrosine phosphatase [Loa loa]EFO27137.2 protein-tyrosine phosphatase [Loa loa]
MNSLINHAMTLVRYFIVLITFALCLLATTQQPKRKLFSISVEIARDAGGEEWIQAVAEVYHSPVDFSTNSSTLTLAERLKIANYKSAQMKYEVVKKEVENNPEILKTHLHKIVHRNMPGYGYHQKGEKKNVIDGKHIKEPGTYTCMVQKKLLEQRLGDENCRLIEPKRDVLEQCIISLADKNSVNDMIKKSARNTVLAEMMLYDVRYDNAWKSDYKKEFNSRGKMKPENRPAWIGISSDFFTRNEKVDLEDARSFILYHRLTRIPEVSKWLENDELNYRNSNLEEFFKKDWDGNGIIRRMNEFNRNVQNDLDRVRLHDRFYNNIVMWEALIGSRKQVYIRTMIGGMERRFEILDNQVNHIVFTHHAFDEHLDLCRNIRIKCRDSTRVVLTYPNAANNDFIHANYIQGGPLFNKFIITQAPMANTIGDFWRMVWQERSPYIFMLISRKEDKRCAQYWPRLAFSIQRTGDQITYYGLTIVNSAVDEFRLPLFRVTYLIVIGPEGDELRVEHWQGDMNNSDNVALPLQLLRLARNCSYPTIIHCHLGISRSAALVAAEICIACLLKGPPYKHCVQKAVQLLRSQRPFCIETPMQYIFIHRVVQKFLHDYVGDPEGFHMEYKDWIEARAMRPFIDDIEQRIPGYRLLSPRLDPDLIRLVRHRERPDCRRETHDCVGQMPIPLQDTREQRFEELQLTKRYPRGGRYD